MTSTTNAFSAPSPTTISSSTTPSPSSSSTTASPTSSSTTASPTSSSTTASPTSSSTTASPTSSSTTVSPTSSSTTASPTSSSTTVSPSSSSTTPSPISSSTTALEISTSSAAAEVTTSSTTQLRTSSTSTPPPTSNAKAEATPPLNTDSKNQKKEYSSIATEPSKNNEVNDNSLFIAAGATIGVLFTASILLLATLYNRNSLTKRCIKRDDELETIRIEDAAATSQSAASIGGVGIDLGAIEITHLEDDTSKYTRKRKRESENNSENDYNKRRKIKKDDHISNHTNQMRENIVDDTAQFTGGADSFWQKLLEYNTDRSISPDRK